jgi:hypothetical protein
VKGEITLSLVVYRIYLLSYSTLPCGPYGFLARLQTGNGNHRRERGGVRVRGFGFPANRRLGTYWSGAELDMAKWGNDTQTLMINRDTGQE